MIRYLLLTSLILWMTPAFPKTACGKVDHQFIDADSSSAKEYGISYEMLEDEEFPGCKVVELMGRLKLSGYDLSGIEVEMSNSKIVTGWFSSAPIQGEDHFRTVFLLCKSTAHVANTSVHYGDNCYGKTVVLPIASK